MMACPSAATLARLGTDSFEDETLSTLEGHIACCPDCQAGWIGWCRTTRPAGLADAVGRCRAATMAQAPRVRDRARAGPREHERRLPGAAAQPRPPGGAEGRAERALGRLARVRPMAPRGAVVLAAAARERRAAPRRRRGRRLAVPGPRVRPGRDARTTGWTSRTPPRDAARLLDGDRRRGRGDPPGGAAPPRPQAVQHPDGRPARHAPRAGDAPGGRLRPRLLSATTRTPRPTPSARSGRSARRDTWRRSRSGPAASRSARRPTSTASAPCSITS